MLPGAREALQARYPLGDLRAVRYSTRIGDLHPGNGEVMYHRDPSRAHLDAFREASPSVRVACLRAQLHASHVTRSR